jgi:cation diffusion facilitator CzcD-associated flavoprotein CzcO
MKQEHVDVLIVGAGISGIGAAYHLQKISPNKSFLILEGRENLGGTWDLFKYPGLRSDSDMHTLGYSFKPWTGRKAIADGGSILNYLKETAQENGIDKKIRYGVKVKGANWCSNSERWSLDVETSKDDETLQLTCGFLFMCSGYYDYSKGYLPCFNGVDSFSGQIVHPQNWPEDLDYNGKRIVVIGSGATAVTLLPELAKKSSHITMLQRSPTYVVSQPEEDDIANSMHRYLPHKLAHSLTRGKNILSGILMFQYHCCPVNFHSSAI